MACRILVADDHKLLRAGLRRLLERSGYMKVVAETGDGSTTLSEVPVTMPDVVLLDLRMPRTEPLAVIETIRRNQPHVRVIVMTGQCDAETMRQVLTAGAAGIVLKASGSERLLEAIRVVIAGRLFVDTDIYLDTSTTALPRLTQRERRIMVLLARGASYRDVAQRLHIGERTIETYRRRIADKLGLSSRADFVRFALECGMLELGHDRN